ncbi:hypothetical protein ACB094_06G103600 [Castanea mollissima]
MVYYQKSDQLNITYTTTVIQSRNQQKEAKPMNIKKQIFRKRKREGKIRYKILRASHLRNWASVIGDFVMAMMGNRSVIGGRDGYGGLSGMQREWLREAKRTVDFY